MADLQGCNVAKLLQHTQLMHICQQAIEQAGLTIVAQLDHVFQAHPKVYQASSVQQDGGVTLTFLLAESHVCVHTWPEQAGATLDVYVCNLFKDNGLAAMQVLEQIMQWLEPTAHTLHTVRRGSFAGA